MLDKLSSLSTKEMDRKEFLQNAGIGMLLAMGGGLIVRTLGMSFGGSQSPRNQAAGYGASTYGGR